MTIIAIGTIRTKSFLSKQYCRYESRNVTVNMVTPSFSWGARSMTFVTDATGFTANGSVRSRVLIYESPIPEFETLMRKSRERFRSKSSESGRERTNQR